MEPFIHCDNVPEQNLEIVLRDVNLRIAVVGMKGQSRGNWRLRLVSLRALPNQDTSP